MVPFLIVIALVIVVAGPSFWVKRTIKRHAHALRYNEHTGEAMARMLLDQHGLQDVKVEETKLGDHYDPASRTVRLLPEHFGQPTLSAIVIAAHEVGHAIQHRDGYKPLTARTQAVKTAAVFARIGAVVSLVAPLVFAFSRSPGLTLLTLMGGILAMGGAVVVHFMTLPVEVDASFKRALPLLERGGHVLPRDMDGAHQLLKVAAYTYVAGSLASLLNLAAWLRYLR